MVASPALGWRLSATERTTVGLGVVSATVRHPTLLATEISTISAAYPGRLIAGLGLGVPGWIRQMGLHPRSPLAAMRESVTSVRPLLSGETLDEQGDVFDFHDVLSRRHPLSPRMATARNAGFKKTLTVIIFLFSVPTASLAATSRVSP